MIILSQGKFPEILYIDGFAGPGQYSKGEPGSPIIALDTALGYKPPLTAKMHFLFVEADKERANHLRRQIALRQPCLSGCVPRIPAMLFIRFTPTERWAI